MGFFLLGRDSDVVRLVSNEVFETREAALVELSRAVSDARVDVTEEFSVVDLDTAIPVLVVPVLLTSADETTFASADEQETTPVLDEPAPSDADVWEAPLEEPAAEPVPPAPVLDPAIADAIVADAADTEDALVVAAADEPAVPLRDALERAAGTLESTGIVAPDSVGPAADEETPAEEPSAASWPWDTAVAPEEDEPAEEAPLEDEPPAEEVPAYVAPVEEPQPYVLDPLEEPALDDGPLIQPAGGLDEAESRPVIMGAYEDAPPVAEPASVAPPLVEEAPAVDAPPPAPVAPEESGLLGDLEELPPVAAEPEPTPEPEPAPEAEPKVYEAGASDLGAFTCDDCVYLNTCPKRGESDPSNCGSFQWKTV